MSNPYAPPVATSRRTTPGSNASYAVRMRTAGLYAGFGFGFAAGVYVLIQSMNLADAMWTFAWVSVVAGIIIAMMCGAVGRNFDQTRLVHYVREQRATMQAIETHTLGGDGSYPNNPLLPLLIYRRAVGAPQDVPSAEAVEDLLRSNGWGGTWRNGVFPYHHYHSNAHEVLVVCAGTARLQFGGPSGPVVAMAIGDVAILPAGTAHKRVDASDDFMVIGAYPKGMENYDLIREEPTKRDTAVQRISWLPLPQCDPIHGPDGPLRDHWKA